MFVALSKIARIYSQNYAVNVAVNFNSSLDFINEIDSGEPADIFITAHPVWSETLRQKGLIDVYNIGYVADDKLVLATSKNNKELSPKLLKKDLTLEEAILIIDENKNNLIVDHEGSSSGIFAKNFLQNFTFENLNIFTKLQEDRNSLVYNLKNDRNAYALIFESQIRKNSDLKIIAYKNDKNIFYRALVIAGDNMDVAREFLKFLKNSTAQKIFKENNFIVK
jgi:molybdate transport system substrate-binding protein